MEQQGIRRLMDTPRPPGAVLSKNGKYWWNGEKWVTTKLPPTPMSPVVRFLLLVVALSMLFIVLGVTWTARAACNQDTRNRELIYQDYCETYGANDPNCL
jgi:hypothetical protein